MIIESKFYMTNYEHFMMTLEQKNNMHHRAVFYMDMYNACERVINITLRVGSFSWKRVITLRVGSFSMERVILEW